MDFACLVFSSHVKVAKLRLKIPLKIKDNSIGTKAISEQTSEQWSQAFANAKLSKAWERFGKGLEGVREMFREVRER